MKRSIKIWHVGVACLATVFATQSANAATVFNNSTTDLLTRFDPAAFEVGDEIVLQGFERYITSFTFQYWGEGLSGGEQVQVKFYPNDGPLVSLAASPGIAFYDSGPFSIGNTVRSTILLDSATLAENLLNPGQPVLAPSSFTWSVQFFNVAGAEKAGVDLYDPPSTGIDYNSYWEKDPLNGWLLKTNAFSIPMNFGARVEAVPEPNTVALGLGGALLVFLFRAGMRRK